MTKSYVSQKLTLYASSIHLLSKTDFSVIDSELTESMSILAAEATILQYTFPPYTRPLAHLFSTQVAFCLAVGALLNGVRTDQEELAVYAVHGLDLRSGFTERGNQTWQAFQATSLVAVCILTWIRGPHEEESQPRLPSPRRIPFLTNNHELPLALPREMTGEIPRLTPSTVNTAFSLSPSWQAWYRACIAQFVEDIGNGTWQGFTTNSSITTHAIGLQLTGIRFTNLKKTETSIEGEADGSSDAEGPVKLTVQIARDTGAFELTRRPRDALSGFHRMSGTMTPLGLIGVWGEEEEVCNGLLWLYKEEWVPPRDAR